MLNKQRMVDTFLQLVQIDSPSGKEREVVNFLYSLLKSELGAVMDIATDDGVFSRHKNYSDAGNIIAKITTGKRGGMLPLLLSAHMDTVGPSKGIKPVIRGDIITSDGTTILGADDKAGIAVVLEVVRTMKEENMWVDIEVVFTVCEEIGLLGAKNLGFNLLSNSGIVIDGAGEPTKIVNKAPAAATFEFVIYGREAHAGRCPEEGINAIAIAAKAIAQMDHGRIDEETTVNIGRIEGGIASNIVPHICRFRGGARSHDDQKLEAQLANILNSVRDAVSERQVTVDGQTYHARFDFEKKNSYPKLVISADAYIISLMKKAAQKLGQRCELAASGGGSDANIFAQRGIETVVVSAGMHNIHTREEYLDTNQMFRAAELVFQTVVLHRES